jgi:hypothetical protein
MTIARVTNIAMPPPSGTTDWPYLSAAGFERRLNFGARLLTAAVRIAERTKEPASSIIDNMISG